MLGNGSLKEARVVVHFTLHPRHFATVQELDEDTGGWQLRTVRGDQRRKGLQGGVPGAELVLPHVGDSEVALVCDKLLIASAEMREEDCEEVQDRGICQRLTLRTGLPYCSIFLPSVMCRKRSGRRGSAARLASSQDKVRHCSLVHR